MADIRFVHETPFLQMKWAFTKLFVRKGVLKNSPDNEIVLTGSSRRKRRTLGGLITSQYAKEEILPEYYELMNCGN